jgi:hypothetical protein
MFNSENNFHNRIKPVMYSDLMTQLASQNPQAVCAEYENDVFGRIRLWLGLA